MFAVIGPSQIKSSERFAARTEAEFCGTALARQAGVSLWFQALRRASFEREFPSWRMRLLLG